MDTETVMDFAVFICIAFSKITTACKKPNTQKYALTDHFIQYTCSTAS